MEMAAATAADGRVTKIGLAGVSGVGKSLLLARLVGPNFPPTDNHANFQKTTLLTRDDRPCELLVADLSGASQHVLAGKNLYSFCSGLLMIFDLTDEGSFTNAVLRLVHGRVANIPVIMVGNKCDCRVDNRRISRERIQIVCDEMEIGYIEVSAKEKINVEFAFEKIVELIQSGHD